MKIETLIDILNKNKRLSTSEENFTFDSAIQQFPNTDDYRVISELLRVFTDEAIAFEVMWGLVHLVEGLDYIPALVDLTPEMLTSAKSWLKLLYSRIVTTERFREKLKQVLASTPEQKTSVVTDLIKELAKEWDDEFTKQAQEILI